MHAPHGVLPSLTGSESPHSVRMKVTASIDSAAVVLDSAAGEVLRAAMENLTAGAQKYPKALALDLELRAVGITSPEGTFLRSGAQLMHSSSLAAREHGGEAAAASCCAWISPPVHLSECREAARIEHPDVSSVACRCARAQHCGGRWG
jgi:hypothetical protein